MEREAGSQNVRAKSSSNRNPYVVISVTLGFLTGLNAILSGSSFYYAGFPAHGSVPIIGIFLGIFGLLTVLGSLLVIKRNLRIVGAVLVLVFGVFQTCKGCSTLHTQ